MTEQTGQAEQAGGVEQTGAGAPDGFARLWAPHRLAYVTAGAGDPSADPGGDPAAPVTERPARPCPFCAAPAQPDEQTLIVARGETVYALLNLYPYNPGHLMVLPYRHCADLTDLTAQELAEFGRFTCRALTAIRAASNPDGFNVGINAGAAAGAGIAGHLHQHVVPRWSGDQNFMPVIGQTKVLPQLLSATREAIAAAW